MDPGLQLRLKDEILAAYMADTIKTRFLDRNGRYFRLPRRKGQVSFSAQDFLIALAEGTATAADIPEFAMPPLKIPSKRRREMAIR